MLSQIKIVSTLEHLLWSPNSLFVDASDSEQQLKKKSDKELKNKSDKELKKLQAKRDQLACLIGFMDDCLKPIFELRQSIANGSLQDISYNGLWHLFQPGDLIVSNSSELSDPRRAYRVLHVTGGRPIMDSLDQYESYVSQRRRRQVYDSDDEDVIVTLGSRMTPLIIDCFYLDFDGYRFGPRSMKIRLEEYKGCRLISDLEAIPLRFLPDATHIQQTLTERGRQFIGLVPTAHRLYEGLNTIDHNSKDYKEQVGALRFPTSQSHPKLTAFR